MDIETYLEMQTKKFKIAMKALGKIAEATDTSTEPHKLAVDAITKIDPLGHSPWKKWVIK